ncbi:MAG: imidazoleglycerol-phosphate dehydratase HisB [Defluviitaleaceae bacterium]|nr:imidazoleglycerol-phosphate dehydratase HisB [Defluviitaleaceae bacterium]
MREAVVNRETLETKIKLQLNLDNPGAKISTGVGFFDHMLNLLAFRAGIGLEVSCQGDLHVDDHHTIEDVGIALGTAFAEAISDKRGINRYGNAAIPMDEALAECALDISGRGFLVFNAQMPQPQIGNFNTEMTEEFFRAFATKAGITLHINLRYGKNTHHIIEAIFKAVGVAISQAIKVNGTEISSTKGLL